MIPETWLPTWTVVTAEIVPVAVTVAATTPSLDRSPSGTSASVFSFPARRKRRSATATAATATTA